MKTTSDRWSEIHSALMQAMEIQNVAYVGGKHGDGSYRGLININCATDTLMKALGFKEEAAPLDTTHPIEEVREKLAYRTPTSNQPLGHIVLERERAEQLVAEWDLIETRITDH